MSLKKLYARWRLFCLDLNVLIYGDRMDKYDSNGMVPWNDLVLLVISLLGD